jgi:phospholipid transport system transporter-binding protein
MQLPQTLTLAGAGDALAALRAAAARGDGKVLGIDASRLRSFDSAALALLLQAKRLALSSGRELRVSGAPPQLAQLAQLYGVAELLDLTPAG